MATNNGGASTTVQRTATYTLTLTLPTTTTNPPALTAFNLSPSAFPAAPSGPTVLAARSFGTLVSYKLSEAASVKFTVQRNVTGHKKGKRCFKQQTGVRFPVLLSTDPGAYEAMNLPRGSLRQIFGIAAQRVARRRAKGVGLDRQAEGGNRPKARPEQDWHQLGGAFVFARAGQLVWSHRARHDGDSPDHRLLGEALRADDHAAAQAHPSTPSRHNEPARDSAGTPNDSDAQLPRGGAGDLIAAIRRVV